MTRQLLRETVPIVRILFAGEALEEEV